MTIRNIALASLLTMCAALNANADTMGVLVIAPDRGFMGNEVTRAAFAGVDQPLKQLVFVTDENSRTYFDAALNTMTEAGMEKLAVLPFFISDQHPDWRLAKSWLTEDVCKTPSTCDVGRSFGQSYLAVDVLDEALEQVADVDGKRLILVGAGADNEKDAQAIAADLKRIASWANNAAKFESVSAAVWLNDGDYEAQVETLQGLGAADDAVLVGFHLGWALDSMMSFDSILEHRLQRSAANGLVNAPIDSAVASIWMQREVNRRLIDSADDVGVVIQAHGSDFHWNQTMRDAIAPLHDRYAVEYAFSMADRPSIEMALERLQERGVRGAVIVRVFGRIDSFQSTIESMIGIDVETGTGMKHHHGAGHAGHGGHMMGGGRIRTPLAVTSSGGLEDHALFAEALLERANAISRDPATETVILVAHGTGDDDANTRWVGLLESLAKQMAAMGGDDFRAIQYATWREDWPDKREEWVARVRDMVKTANDNGGRALVIPARTNATGPEEEFLEGLEFELGEGFAPHPLFAKWIASHVEAGISQLTGQSSELIAKGK